MVMTVIVRIMMSGFAKNNKISQDSDANLMLKKGTSASPATALASKVLPVPGGPTSNTPEGARAPSFINLSGLLSSSCISLMFVYSYVSHIPSTACYNRMWQAEHDLPLCNTDNGL